MTTSKRKSVGFQRKNGNEMATVVMLAIMAVLSHGPLRLIRNPITNISGKIANCLNAEPKPQQQASVIVFPPARREHYEPDPKKWKERCRCVIRRHSYE